MFCLHDGSVWIEAGHRIVVFWLKSIANYPFIARDCYYFDSWMDRVIWGDYSQIKGKHQSFWHFYIDAGQGLGQKNTNMFRISEQNPSIRTWPFFFKFKKSGRCFNRWKMSCSWLLNFNYFDINKADFFLLSLSFQNLINANQYFVWKQIKCKHQTQSASNQ